MPSAIAREITNRRRARYAAMSPAERVAVSLRLSDEGIRSFMLTQRLDRPAAIARIKALHRLGRRPSTCADADFS
jgi:hypothetical protein